MDNTLETIQRRLENLKAEIGDLVDDLQDLQIDADDIGASHLKVDLQQMVDDGTRMYYRTLRMETHNHTIMSNF